MSSQILQFVTQYSLYIGCILFSLGIIGNALNILVFAQLKLFQHSRCAFYLIVESIFCLIYQLIPMTLTILTSIYGDDATGRSSIWCKFRYILAQPFPLMTYCIICVAAIDQFFSTNYLFNLRQMCTMKLARCLTVIIFWVWIVHSIVIGLSYDIQPSLGCVMSNPTLLQYSTYFLYPVLAGLLPVTIASFFSILAYRNVRRLVRRQIPIVRRRLDQQITAMVLIRVILFVCLTLPYMIFRIYTVNYPLRRNESLEYAILRLIQVILYNLFNSNYSASFYAFVITSSRFRRQLKFVLVKKCWKQCKSGCCSSHNQVNPECRQSVDENIGLEENG